MNSLAYLYSNVMTLSCVRALFYSSLSSVSRCVLYCDISRNTKENEVREKERETKLS